MATMATKTTKAEKVTKRPATSTTKKTPAKKVTKVPASQSSQEFPTLRTQLEQYMSQAGLSSGAFEVTVAGNVYVIASMTNPILEQRYDPTTVGIEVKKNAVAG